MTKANTLFRHWYAHYAGLCGLDPDPDHPDHHYDFRAAWMAGAIPGADLHWPSEFKRESHPRLFVQDAGGLLNTKTGERFQWVA